MGLKSPTARAVVLVAVVTAVLGFMVWRALDPPEGWNFWTGYSHDGWSALAVALIIGMFFSLLRYLREHP